MKGRKRKRESGNKGQAQSQSRKQRGAACCLYRLAEPDNGHTSKRGQNEQPLAVRLSSFTCTETHTADVTLSSETHASAQQAAAAACTAACVALSSRLLHSQSSDDAHSYTTTARCNHHRHTDRRNVPVTHKVTFRGTRLTLLLPSPLQHLIYQICRS